MPVTALRLILGFSILSTAAHYTHNFIRMDDYPGGGVGVQVAIVLSWPLLTAIGLYGYRLYAAGRFPGLVVCAIAGARLAGTFPRHEGASRVRSGNPCILA